MTSMTLPLDRPSDPSAAAIARVRAALADAEGDVGIGEIVERTGLDNRVARDALARLARRHEAERTGRGRYRYRSTSPKPGPALAPPPSNGRRPWGTVRRAALAAFAAEPGRTWTGPELAEQLGITANHAVVLLADLTRKGKAERLGPSVYRPRPAVGPEVAADPDRNGAAGARAGWSPVAVEPEVAVLLDDRLQLWIARPATTG